ncbi:hypothetical protein [Planomonospora parontospora]|nr:hypothetical protein [Planomonospora parontospora]
MTTPPPRTGRLTYDNDVMACPLCGDPDGTHVDHVYVAARQEDQEFTYLSINATTGEMDKVLDRKEIPPVGKLGEARRHRIALMGWCEMCGEEFSIIFTQQKGQTLVETVPVNEGPIYRTGRR